MLDIQLLRQDVHAVAERLSHRKNPQTFLNVGRFQALESRRKALQTHQEELRAQRNGLAKRIGMLKGRGEPIDEALAQAEEVAQALSKDEQALQDVQAALTELLMQVPNLPQPDVPAGPDETANVLVRQWGTPRDFPFAARDHVSVGEGLGLDFDTGAKLAGSRFAFMRGPVARLHRALAAFMLDVHTIEHGYQECQVPYIVNREVLEGTGQLPKFKDDMFWVQRGGDVQRAEQYLVSTAEIPLTNSVREEILDAKTLPLRLTAHTPCFRSEAGAAGRDVRGLIRQHQFDKVEMVQIVKPQDGERTLQEMVGHAEVVLQRLELPYRVMLLATGDMGFTAAKTYDLEVWLPAQATYREISSCSTCGDFQARRMRTRYRDDAGKPQFVHTLNGSGLAVGRTLVALLENHQQGDGSVRIPAALQPYLGGVEVLR